VLPEDDLRIETCRSVLGILRYINILEYHQNVLPEDDLRIETCRSVLGILR